MARNAFAHPDVAMATGLSGVSTVSGAKATYDYVVAKDYKNAAITLGFTAISAFTMFMGCKILATPPTVGSTVQNRMVEQQPDGEVNTTPKSVQDLSTIDDYVDLTEFRKDHILNRHRAGGGKIGKTEFPANWSDDRILHNISDVATDPTSITGVGKYNSPYAIGIRDGIEIRVDFYPDTHPQYSGMISTAYPINVPVNSAP